MAIKLISFKIWWSCACDPDAYHGFNLALTLCGQTPDGNPIEQIYVRPPYEPTGVYSYEVRNYTYDDALCYEVWVQAVTYNGLESMWRSVSGIEVPDGSGAIILNSSSTQDELDSILDGKTIDGETTDLNNINGGNVVDGSIDGSKIADDSISTSHIVVDAITSRHIQSDTITAGHIQANSIISTHLSSGSITADHLQSHIIQAGHIEAGAITANEANVGSLLSVSAEVTGTLTVTGAGKIALGNGNILASGSITAASGTVGGWVISSDKIESDVGTANRITLDKTLSRISIVSDTSATKVAMGYLSGLPKNNGSGNYTVADYGFYAAPGDTLHIDGDAEYTSGDWIIQHDSAYLVKDSSGKTIVRLGSDSGTHGLHIYNTSGTKLAEYSSSKILIGTESRGALTSGLRYTLAGGLELVGKMTISASDVIGLGTLATKSSIANSDITSIDGGKITTGTIILNNSGTSVRVNNLGKIRFYPGTTVAAAEITCDSRYGLWISGTNKIHIESSNDIGISSSSRVSISASSGVSIVGAVNSTVGYSAPTASLTGNLFSGGIVLDTYSMEVGRGQPKRLTTRSVATSYIDFDYSSGYIKIAANGGTMVNAVAYSSDYRLKENIIPLEQSSIINLMDSVQPYKFNFIGQSKEEYGVLAQDLAMIFPECVCEMHEGYFGVNYHMLTTLLIDCVRNLNTRVKELEAT